MNKQEQTALMQKCKDESAKELGYEDFNDANAWMVTHEQQFTTDPANNIMFNILELAMEKYAKAVVVRFADWIDEHDIVRNGSGQRGWGSFRLIGFDFDTTEELFNKYTDQ